MQELISKTKNHFLALEVSTNQISTDGSQAIDGINNITNELIDMSRQII